MEALLSGVLDVLKLLLGLIINILVLIVNFARDILSMFS